MREIKFRAWDKKTKKMQQNIQRCHDALGVEGHTEDWFGAYFGDGHVEPEEQIKRYSVMQYIGLQDCKGVDIYEGDIVRCGWFYGDDYGEPTGEMQHTNQIVEYKIDKWKQSAGFNFNVHGIDKHGEVIGNIYENPELLKK